ncbi:phage tail protein [Sulfitobacter sp. PR48]|uniref:phage tail protein n=1 Tax=Sulfitobacter sp. PR48 TaxID=3028383 RepID=UPI00237AB0A8|nr:tail fiber protein [Sulfitobacter sp. PR48]
MFTFKRMISALAPVALAAGISAPALPAAAQEYWIGQIVMGGWNFCPRTTTEADGQLLPISPNAALFSLFGTMYGGDGRTTFALPDLRGRVPMHTGNGPGLTPRSQGQKFGTETVTLTEAQMPSHNHLMRVSNLTGNKQRPANDYISFPNFGGMTPSGEPLKIFADELLDSTPKTLETDAITNAGGNQAHPNIQPVQVIRYCVVLQGLYPSRN